MMRPYRRLLLLFLPALLAATFSSRAEDAQGMEAGKAEMARLVAIAIDGGQLALDRKVWEQKDPEEPTDPEERKAWEKKKLAKAMGREADQISDELLKAFGPHYLSKTGCQGRFQEYMNTFGGMGGGSGGGSSGTQSHWRIDKSSASGRIESDTATGSFRLQITEKTLAERILVVEDDKDLGFTLRLAERASGRSLLFVQTPKGSVTLVVTDGDAINTYTANDFAGLLRKHPAETQVKFLRPLAAIGIEPPLHPLLPPVMAAATTGFGAGAAEHASQADALIAKLSDEDAAARDEATGALIKLYPFAVSHVRSAEAKSEDAETKMRLKKVIAAHPTIEKALDFVKEKKLHEDKAYLLDLLANVPFFRKSTQARLAALYGKDYGEDAPKWPMP
ncbi:MAG: hypothetical protein L6R28_07680 [Planctomycetes bacterium]|nr:hypothetical protein [Planctomycetota bacterium]